MYNLTHNSHNNNIIGETRKIYTKIRFSSECVLPVIFLRISGKIFLRLNIFSNQNGKSL